MVFFNSIMCQFAYILNKAKGIKNITHQTYSSKINGFRLKRFQIMNRKLYVFLPNLLQLEGEKESV